MKKFKKVLLQNQSLIFIQTEVKPTINRRKSLFHDMEVQLRKKIEENIAIKNEITQTNWSF